MDSSDKPIKPGLLVIISNENFMKLKEEEGRQRRETRIDEAHLEEFFKNCGFTVEISLDLTCEKIRKTALDG